MEIEDRYVTSTPEGVSLSVVLAGRRLADGAAYLIDFAVQTVSIIGVNVALTAIVVDPATSAFVASGISR